MTHCNCEACRTIREIERRVQLISIINNWRNYHDGQRYTTAKQGKRQRTRTVKQVDKA